LASTPTKRRSSRSIDALAEARLPGFHASAVCRVEEPGWLPGRDTAYEDWYLADGFADLGTLNEGAVADPCRAPHNEVARLAAGGTTGLYRLATGAEGPGFGYLKLGRGGALGPAEVEGYLWWIPAAGGGDRPGLATRRTGR
jgi:hypothetical protein